MERFSRLIIRHRFPFIITILILTGFLVYAMKDLGFKTVLESTLPPQHPYVQINAQFQKMFGGANTMVVAVESKKGDIFNKKFLEKFKFLTDEIKFYPDAVTSQVISISQAKVKNIRGMEGGMDIRAFFEKGAPQTEQEIAALRENIFSNESVRGILVSATGNAALIIANFKDNIDYQKLFRFLQKTKSQVEDDDIKVYMSGRPTLLGWIYDNNFRAFIIFAVSVLAELLLIGVCLKRFHPLFTPLPVVLALLNAIWGLGVMGLVKFNLDPLGMVIPFVIGARIISHVVQITERYGEHYMELADTKEASVAVIRSMFIPSAASIITDAAGLFVLCIVPIPLLRSLGWIAGLWLLSAVVGVSILCPILFSYLPAPLKEGQKKDALERLMERLGKWLTGGSGRGSVRRSMGWVLGIWIIIFAGAILLAQRAEIGDAHPGSSLLWPNSVYNRDDERINGLFPGTNQMYVILDGKEQGVLKDPEVLRSVEAFERDIAGSEGFGGSESLVAIIKKLDREFHEGDPKWSMLPASAEKTAFYLWMFESKSDPGDLDRWTDIHYQYGNIISYFKDHKGETVRGAISRAKQFLAANSLPADKVSFRLAGGVMGVTAATDEVVAKYNDLTLWIALGVIFICCVIPYRSFGRAFVLLASLVTANYVTMAYMAISKMGMTINVLPVAAIGAGLGVDYGIYMLSRIDEEYPVNGGDVLSSIRNAFVTTGRAVFITGMTVVMGIAFWYFSELRFQAEMGFLMAFLILMNMVGAVFLVPALVYSFRGKLFSNLVKGKERRNENE